MKLISAALLAITLLVCSPAYGQEQLAPEVLARLKAATVYLQTPDGAGSGLLYRADGKIGWIVSNAHLFIDPKRGNREQRTVSCVFHSGTKKSFTVEGKVELLEKGKDLAIVKIDSTDDLPAVAFDNLDEDDLQETMSVYTLGFPFGDILRTQAKSPNITISRGSVTSLRRDKNDELSIIQVDAGINPGNSGGPVVNREGKIVGIAVAKVLGTDLGFVIPAKIVKATIDSHHRLNVSFKIEQVGSYTINSGRVRVTASIGSDRKIRKVELLAGFPRQSELKQNADGDWDPIASVASATFEGEGNSFVVDELLLPLNSDLTVTPCLQCRITDVEDRVIYSQPIQVGLKLKGLPEGVDTVFEALEPAPPWTPKWTVADLNIDLPDVVQDVVPLAYGEYLALRMKKEPKVLILHVPTGKIEATLEVRLEEIIAGDRKYFIAQVGSSTLRVWKVGDWERPFEVEWPLPMAAQTMAMGCANSKYLGVLVGNQGNFRFYVLEWDQPVAERVERPRLKLVSFPRVFIESGEREIKLADPLTIEQRGNELRSSFDGRCWVVGYPGVSGLRTITPRESWLHLKEGNFQGSFKHLRKSPNTYLTPEYGSFGFKYMIDGYDGTVLQVPTLHGRHFRIEGNDSDDKRLAIGHFGEELVNRTNSLKMSIEKCLHYYCGPAVLVLVSPTKPLVQLRNLKLDRTTPVASKETSLPEKVPPSEVPAKPSGEPMSSSPVLPKPTTPTPSVPPIPPLASLPPSFPQNPTRADRTFGLKHPIQDFKSQYRPVEFANPLVKYGRTAEIPLPGTCLSVVPCGGGKFLAFVFIKSLTNRVASVAVMDVSRLRWVYERDLQSPHLVGTADKLIMADPKDHAFTIVNLSDWQEKTVKIPWSRDDALETVAAGCNSTGPLLVITSQQNWSLQLRYLNPETLEPMTAPEVTMENTTRLKKLDKQKDFFVLPKLDDPSTQFIVLRPMAIAAHGGESFVITSLIPGLTGFYTLYRSGDSAYLLSLSRDNLATFLPTLSPDSRWLLHQGGAFHALPSNPVFKGATVGCYHSDCYLAFASPPPGSASLLAPNSLLALVPSRNHSPQNVFPVLPEITLEKLGPLRHAPPIPLANSISHRIHFYPQADLLLTVNATNDKVYARTIQHNLPLTKFEPLVVAPQMRKWVDRTGKFNVQAVFIKETAGVVSLRRENGETFELPLERLSPADREYVQKNSPPR